MCGILFLYTAKVINIFRHEVMNGGFFHGNSCSSRTIARFDTASRTCLSIFSEFKAHENKDFSFLFRRGRKYRSYARIKNQGSP